MGSVDESRLRTVRMILRANGHQEEIEGALEGFEAAVRNDERRRKHDGMTRRFCTTTLECRLADGHKGGCVR